MGKQALENRDIPWDCEKADRRKPRMPVIRIATFAVLLTLSISSLAIGWPLTAQDANAAKVNGRSGCRQDPLVFLSNGTVVQMTAMIDTDASNVTQINYVLHAPANTTVTRVVFTGNTQIPETFRFYADAASGTYVGETLVQTSERGVSIAALMRIASSSGEARGLDMENLTIQLSR